MKAGKDIKKQAQKPWPPRWLDASFVPNYMQVLMPKRRNVRRRKVDMYVDVDLRTGDVDRRH